MSGGLRFRGLEPELVKEVLEVHSLEPVSSGSEVRGPKSKHPIRCPPLFFAWSIVANTVDEKVFYL